MNNFGNGKKPRLSKVYFVWTIRDFGSAECKSSNPNEDQSEQRIRLIIKGFQSLLQAIEAEDTEGRIEIHIYLTAKIEYVSLTILNTLVHPNPFLTCAVPLGHVTVLMDSEDKMNNILVNDVGAETDAITSLRSPTHFGRPNVSPPTLLLTPISTSLPLTPLGPNSGLTASGIGYSSR